MFQISLFLLLVMNSPGSQVIFGFADWKATLYVSYYTHYKVILVFVILQIFSTRWKNVNEQHIVCYLGCLLFSILWYVFRNVTEHSETFSELVTHSEIDFKFSVNSDFMILFQCFCFFRGKLSLEYFSFDSFDVSAFEFGST